MLFRMCRGNSLASECVSHFRKIATFRVANVSFYPVLESQIRVQRSGELNTGFYIALCICHPGLIVYSHTFRFYSLFRHSLSRSLSVLIIYILFIFICTPDWFEAVDILCNDVTSILSTFSLQVSDEMTIYLATFFGVIVPNGISKC